MGSPEATCWASLRDAAAGSPAAHVGAVAKLTTKGLKHDGTQHTLRFSEKGGKSREIPVRHDVEQVLLDYVKAAGITEGPLFRTTVRKTKTLTMTAMTGIDICRMMKRRLRSAKLPDQFSPHSFRVTTVTDLLEQNTAIEDVQNLAGDADPRTTRLNDRRRRMLTRNIVERISVKGLCQDRRHEQPAATPLLARRIPGTPAPLIVVAPFRTCPFRGSGHRDPRPGVVAEGVDREPFALVHIEDEVDPGDVEHQQDVRVEANDFEPPPGFLDLPLKLDQHAEDRALKVHDVLQVQDDLSRCQLSCLGQRVQLILGVEFDLGPGGRDDRTPLVSPDLKMRWTLVVHETRAPQPQGNSERRDGDKQRIGRDAARVLSPFTMVGELVNA
jgi:hypothetical protein